MQKRYFRKQLIRSTVLYLTILLIGIFVLTGYIYGKNISKITSETNQNFLALMKSQTEHFLEHPLNEMLRVENQIVDSSKVQSGVNIDYDEYILRIEYLDEKGTVERVYPNQESRVGLDMSHNPFLSHLSRNQVSFSETYVDSATGQVVMMVGKKIENTGYIIGYMKLDKLQTAFSNFQTHDKIYSIIDSKGNYLLHPSNFEVKSRSVNPHAASIRSGEYVSGDIITLSGKKYILEFIGIDNTGWYLLAYQEYFDTYEPLFLSISIVLVALIIAFYFVSRLFNMRFSKLEAGFFSFIDITKKVSMGDYSAIQSDYEYTEFDELSESFVAMINEIESREEEILKINLEIQESRSELMASNDELNTTLQQLMEIEIAQREQYENLDRQNKRLENLIEGTHAGTWEWEITSDEVVINKRWAEILKYDLDDFVPFSGQKFFSMLHPDDVEPLNRCVNAVFKDEIPFFDVRFRMRNKDQEWVWINSIAKVLKRDENKTPLLMSGIHMDISKTVEYELSLIESKELANAANIAKSQFLANMSHEIRTPLNGISGYLILILESAIAPEVKEYSQTALKITQSMVRLVDDILDFSRIEAGKLRLIHESVDVHEKLFEILDLYKYETHTKSIQLSYHITENVPKAIIGDATRLKQIMTNLISNAIKFSSNGNIEIEIDAQMSSDNQGTLIYSVSDSGIGIPSDQIKAIFEPFNQGDNSSKRRFGGTGLGLAIVKQMVELMSGSIDVKSVSGVGSMFIVQIPFSTPVKELNRSDDNKLTPSIHDVKAKVLIVDDNDINQMVVRKVLEIKGFDCDIASNGEEAIEAILKTKYDCVFMDVQMPIMDGYDATKKIRELKHREEVFIIAMTANAMSGDRDKCIAVGMDDYVSKPLNYDLMIDMVLKHKSEEK